VGAGQAEAELIVGEPRIALNHSDASIHNEVEAKKLGFRGSAVGGNVHLDLFVPPLLEAYGNEWFEHGGLSVYFLNIVVSGEPVRAVVKRPTQPGAQTRIEARRAEDEEFVVCAGTASLGDHTHSELSTRDLRLCDHSELRLLKGVPPGHDLGISEGMVTTHAQQALIESGSMNEPLDWYLGASPWGGPIASVSSTAGMMFRHIAGGEQEGYPRLPEDIGKASGMFGAFEVVYVHGPVFLDRPYAVSGTVVGVGESPKTEYLWWDAETRDESGSLIARMRHLLRFIKASSPLYPELQGA
jgi:hypothetical protein